MIIILLNLFLEIGTFICIILIINTSSKDSFGSHVISDLDNYFYDVNISPNDNSNNNKSNENISSFSYYKKKLNSRRLVSKSFCLEMLEKFQLFEGSKLSDIFDLNYEYIRRYSIVILSLQCAIELIGIVAIFYCCKEGFKIFRNRSIFKKMTMILYPMLMVAKYICILILLYYFEKGDIEKYNDFLDCKNVKADFFDDFSDVNKIRKCFYAFLILNIAIQGIDRLEKIMDITNDLEKIGT